MLKMRHLLAFGALLIFTSAAILAQQWEYVATLSSDASKGETLIHVTQSKPIVEDRLVMIETRDGRERYTYRVVHVYGEHLLLDRRLDQDFLSGARIFQ